MDDRHCQQQERLLCPANHQPHLRRGMQKGIQVITLPLNTIFLHQYTISTDMSSVVMVVVKAIIISMNAKAVLIGLGVIAVGTFTGLYIKNSLQQRNLTNLSLSQVVRILKLIRKQKYIIYKQVANFAINIAQQTRNSVNSQIIEQFIDGPESPIKVQAEIQKITESVCKNQKTDIDTLNKALEQFQNQEEIISLVRQQERDYQIALSGKLPSFNLAIPEHFTKQKFIAVQNQITKKSYLLQVGILKKMAQYSEEELARNPQLMSDLGNQEKEQEEMLIEQGLGGELQPALAVYDVASIKFKSDGMVRREIGKMEEGYQKIIIRYSGKIQSKTITEQQLNQMEEEVIFYDPLV